MTSDASQDIRPLRTSADEFVRSKTQLAVFDGIAQVSGHRLTRIEVLQTFGEDVLSDAIEHGSTIIAARSGSAAAAIRARRAELGVGSLALARAMRVAETSVVQAEEDQASARIQDLERIAIHLGLDERLLAFDPRAGADGDLGVRLRVLQFSDPTIRLSDSTVLTLAEASSLIRIQNRLDRWLGRGGGWRGFQPSSDYGDPSRPAWSIGYELATATREQLRLGDAPIESMRDLVESTLGIPVIQTRLPDVIAGATLAVGEDRGIVLNTRGANRNVWVRRATLAHELGHLLYDPEPSMRSLRVDRYAEELANPETEITDWVEQRANAFAIALLAPPSAIREHVPTPIREESAAAAMDRFGLSLTAARYHIANSWYRQFDVPQLRAHEPGDEWRVSEEFALDFFVPKEVPESRRGRFSGIVAASYANRLISADTAAGYLECSSDAFIADVGSIQEMYPIPA